MPSDSTLYRRHARLRNTTETENTKGSKETETTTSKKGSSEELHCDSNFQSRLEFHGKRTYVYLP